MSPKHDPAWPDKIMASGMLVTIAGILALLHAAMVAGNVEFKADTSNPLFYLSPIWVMILGIMTFGFGVACYRHQSSLLAMLGILTGILSFGLLGAASLIAILAMWPLVQSFREGEETKLDRHRMQPDEWPDKAIMASVILAAGGALTVLQGILIASGWMAAPVMPAAPYAWAGLSLLVGILAMQGARDAFNLRRPGWVAISAAILIAPAAFWVLGPAFGLLALGYLALARREKEFDLAPVTG